MNNGTGSSPTYAAGIVIGHHNNVVMGNTCTNDPHQKHIWGKVYEQRYGIYVLKHPGIYVGNNVRGNLKDGIKGINTEDKDGQNLE